VRGAELDAGHRAIRQGVVLHRSSAARLLVQGERAYERVEALCPRDLFVRTGQILHSLVLDGEGGVLADLHVAPRDDDFLLLADGIDDARLLAELGGEAQPSSESHALISLAGPYAWELLGALLGPEVVTIGYMTAIPIPELGEGALCLRTGATGEYGYDLLLRHADADACVDRLRTIGERFDLLEVEQGVLDRCALENGFFCPRHRGVLARTPIELQLQWRVRYDHERLGPILIAGRDRQREQDGRRLSWVIGRLEDPPPDPGPLVREDRAIGELLDGFHSPVLGCFVGLALLDRGVAHPWIDGIFTRTDRVALELRVEAPPLIQNRSLFVDPKKHTYAHRHEDRFPPIVPGEDA
jgi:glycine cleavage system aminomethyltransferase T